MDNNKHTDWTAKVRERMEGREMKPSDALWERIGEAFPPAAAPHKLRRLPWGGILGAAAAAALAAVLFLRPGGIPEPGRIEVIPDTAPPVAMSERLDGSTRKAVEESTAADHTAPATVNGSMDSRYPAPKNDDQERDGVSNVMVTQGITAETAVKKSDDAVRNEAAESQGLNAGDAIPDAVTARNSANASKTVKSEPAGMTMEEYISQEQKAIRRRRSLTAAVFASGIPSTSQARRSIGNGQIPYNDIPKYSYDPDNNGFIHDVTSNLSNQGSITNSANDKDRQGGYSIDPESLNGFTPVKYTDDPYNINGNRFNHSRPVSAGLALTMPLNDRFFIESGLYWSWLRSTSHMVSEQSLHSLGVPLKFGWSVSGPWRTSFSLSAGAKAEKVIYAVRSGVRVKEPGIQLAATGSAAVQFDITQHLGLFVAPELSFWFTQTKLPTYNTENPFNLSLKAGVNLKLGK